MYPAPPHPVQNRAKTPRSDRAFHRRKNRRNAIRPEATSDLGGIHTLAPAPPTVTLQRTLWSRPLPLRPLYWRQLSDGPTQATLEPDGLRIDGAATVSFDTYFGGLFEQTWRLYTTAGPLTLTLDLRGRAAIRIWRRTPDTGATLLHEQQGAGPTTITLPPDTPHFRQAGLLWFDVTPLDGAATLARAEWTTPAPPHTSPARLGVVICTFNREPELGAVLDQITDDPALASPIARVIITNQGRPNLRAHPAIAPAAARLAHRLRIVEQANLGGAGGFGRGLLEALDDPDITHVCFLDDDVRLEPESLARMAAFFTLARPGLALGGHMLDSVQPTTLYEAGAIVRPDWTLQPLRHALDLTKPETLDSLLDVTAMHYNGWWMFAFPKSLVADLGMPLPCFIRGDDVEFGTRLHNHGISTVPLPGVGIWHEPFYLKIGSWQLYYETRNALIFGALHTAFTPHQVTVLMLKRVLTYLLTYRYYSAALILRAIEDFAHGPAILDQDPRPIHASLNDIRTRYPEASTPREQVMPAAPHARSPRTVPGLVLTMAIAILRNLLAPTSPHTPPAWLAARDLVWFRVLPNDALAVDTHWDRNLPTYRRDRTTFRTLFPTALRAIWHLRQNTPTLRHTWRTEAPRLTSKAFWHTYTQHPPHP